MSVQRKKYAKFHLKLFWSVTMMILLTSGFFIVFQYFRERQYRIELLNNKLSLYNSYMDKELRDGLPLKIALPDGIKRVTVIDFNGQVLFDTETSRPDSVENHSGRKEFKQALEKGSGYDVRRHSSIVDAYYFYTANKFDNYVIRSSLPYDSALKSHLRVDGIFIIVSLCLLLLFIGVFYNLMRHLGVNLNRLNDFVNKAEHEDFNEYPINFPDDEVGEIFHHIVDIYKRLQNTKEALFIEQRRVFKEQEEQSRIKRQLTQNVAHELKTPVSSIQGYLETILTNREDIPLDTLYGFIEKSYQQSSRLTSLLHDISTLSRIDEAPELIVKEPVDLTKLINDVIDDVSPELTSRKIVLYNNTGVTKLECTGNSSLLYSIFRNLFDNTIAYAGEGVDIHLSCSLGIPCFYSFSFSDSGVGIPDKHLGRIFERFYRIDKGRSRKLGGTGLGLSVVKNAVIHHGGTIYAKERIGGGLELIFTIKIQ
jgi:signal transduction histidine kinase